MKRLFIFMSLLISLTQCSIYKLSFDNFYQKIIIDPVFDIVSPSGVVYSDTLLVKITIAHPDGICAVSVVGDNGAYSETFDYNGAPPTITFFKDIAVKYSDTYTLQDANYSLDFEIKTLEGDPFITNVEFTIHRISVDDLDIDYDSEHREGSDLWSDNEQLTFKYDTTGADIQKIILPDNFNSSPASITVDNSPNISIVNNGKTKSISIPMTTVLPDDYYKTVDREAPLYGDVKIITSGGHTNTHTIGFFEPMLLTLSYDDSITHADDLTVDFTVKHPNDHTKIIITYPSGETVPINDISSLKNGDKYSFTFGKNDHLKYNNKYSHSDGIFPLIIDLYDPDIPTAVYTAKTNITIFRKTMDVDASVSTIDYPLMLPFSDWASEQNRNADSLIITLATSGDTFNTVSISPTITYGVDTTETSDIQFEGFDSHSYSLPVKYFIPNIPDRGTDVSGSISITSKHLHDTQTDNDVFISRWYTNETDFYVSSPKDNPYSFRDLPDVVKNTPPNSGAMWYPVTVSSYLYADFNRDALPNIFNFYYSSDDSSATPISVPLHDGTNTVYTSGALDSKTSTAVYYESSSPSLENIQKTFYIQTFSSSSDEDINTYLYLNINNFNLDKYNPTYDPDFGDVEISSSYDLPSVKTEDYISSGDYGFYDMNNTSPTIWYPLTLNTTTVSGTSSDGEPTSTTHNSLFYHYSHKDSFQLLLNDNNIFSPVDIANDKTGGKAEDRLSSVTINENSIYSKSLIYYINIATNQATNVNLRVVVSGYENDPTFTSMNIPAFSPAHTNSAQYISYDSNYDFSDLPDKIKNARDTSGNNIWVPISIDNSIFEAYDGLEFFCLVNNNNDNALTVYDKNGVIITDAKIIHSTESDEDSEQISDDSASSQYTTVYIYAVASTQLDVSIKIPTAQNTSSLVWPDKATRTYLKFYPLSVTPLTTQRYEHPSTKTEDYISSAYPKKELLTQQVITKHDRFDSFGGSESYYTTNITSVWTDDEGKQYMWLPISIDVDIVNNYSHKTYFEIVNGDNDLLNIRAGQDNTTEYSKIYIDGLNIKLNNSQTIYSSYDTELEIFTFTVYVFVPAIDLEKQSTYNTSLQLKPYTDVGDTDNLPTFVTTDINIPISIDNLMTFDSSPSSTVSSTFKTPSDEGSMWVKIGIIPNNFASFSIWNIVPMSSNKDILGKPLSSLASTYKEYLYTFYTHHGYIRNRGSSSSSYNYDTDDYNLTEMPSIYYYNYYFYKQFNQSYYIQVPIPDADDNGDKKVAIYSQGYFTSDNTLNCEFVSVTLDLTSQSVDNTTSYLSPTSSQSSYAFNISTIPVGFLYGKSGYGSGDTGTDRTWEHSLRWIEVDLNDSGKSGHKYFLTNFIDSDTYIKEVLKEYGSTETLSPLVYDTTSGTMYTDFTMSDADEMTALVGLPMGEHDVFAVINNNTQTRTIVPKTTAQNYDISISKGSSDISTASATPMSSIRLISEAMDNADIPVYVTSKYKHDNVVFFYKDAKVNSANYVRLDDTTYSLAANTAVTLSIPDNVYYEIYFMSVDGIASTTSEGVTTPKELFGFVYVDSVDTRSTDTSDYIFINNISYPEDLYRPSGNPDVDPSVYLPIAIKRNLYDDYTEKSSFTLYWDYNKDPFGVFDESGEWRNQQIIYLSEVQSSGIKINLSPSYKYTSTTVGIKFNDGTTMEMAQFDDFSFLFTKHFINLSLTKLGGEASKEGYVWANVGLEENMDNLSKYYNQATTYIGFRDEDSTVLADDVFLISQSETTTIQYPVDSAYHHLYLSYSGGVFSTVKLYPNSVPNFAFASKTTADMMSVDTTTSTTNNGDNVWLPIKITAVNINDNSICFVDPDNLTPLPFADSIGGETRTTQIGISANTVVYVYVPKTMTEISMVIDYNTLAHMDIDIKFMSDIVTIVSTTSAFTDSEYTWYPIRTSNLSDDNYSIHNNGSALKLKTSVNGSIVTSFNPVNTPTVYIGIPRGSSSLTFYLYKGDTVYIPTSIPTFYLTEDYILTSSATAYSDSTYIWHPVDISNDLNNAISGTYAIYSDGSALKLKTSANGSMVDSFSSASHSTVYIGIPSGSSSLTFYLRYSSSGSIDFVPMAISSISSSDSDTWLASIKDKAIFKNSDQTTTYTFSDDGLTVDMTTYGNNPSISVPSPTSYTYYSSTTTTATYKNNRGSVDFDSSDMTFFAFGSLTASDKTALDTSTTLNGIIYSDYMRIDHDSSSYYLSSESVDLTLDVIGDFFDGLFDDTSGIFSTYDPNTASVLISTDGSNDISKTGASAASVVIDTTTETITVEGGIVDIYIDDSVSSDYKIVVHSGVIVSGNIYVAGPIDFITINGTVSKNIYVNGDVNGIKVSDGGTVCNIYIDGNIVGGSASGINVSNNGKVGNIYIDGDVEGNSYGIFITGSVGSITIDGDVTGNYGINIVSGGSVNSITVGGNVDATTTGISVAGGSSLVNRFVGGDIIVGGVTTENSSSSTRYHYYTYDMSASLSILFLNDFVYVFKGGVLFLTENPTTP